MARVLLPLCRLLLRWDAFADAWRGAERERRRREWIAAFGPGAEDFL